MMMNPNVPQHTTQTRTQMQPGGTGAPFYSAANTRALPYNSAHNTHTANVNVNVNSAIHNSGHSLIPGLSLSQGHGSHQIPPANNKPAPKIHHQTDMTLFREIAAKNKFYPPKVSSLIYYYYYY